MSSTIKTLQEAPVATSHASDSKPAAYSEEQKSSVHYWKGYQRILFRIAFIFFIALSIPNSVLWYDQLIHLDWTSLHYRDLYDIARFGSGINWFGNTIFGNPLLGYANWIITLAVSIVGGLIW